MHKYHWRLHMQLHCWIWAQYRQHNMYRWGLLHAYCLTVYCWRFVPSAIVMWNKHALHYSFIIQSYSIRTCIYSFVNSFIHFLRLHQVPSASKCLTLSDINECQRSGLNGLGPCDQLCINTIGSFICSCATGYSLSPSGYTCDGKCTLYKWPLLRSYDREYLQYM